MCPQVHAAAKPCGDSVSASPWSSRPLPGRALPPPPPPPTPGSRWFFCLFIPIGTSLVRSRGSRHVAAEHVSPRAASPTQRVVLMLSHMVPAAGVTASLAQKLLRCVRRRSLVVPRSMDRGRAWAMTDETAGRLHTGPAWLPRPLARQLRGFAGKNPS